MGDTVHEGETGDGAPSNKRPRISGPEPDLRIILKFTKDESGDVQEKEYWMHSAILVGQSNFVAASLSVGMREKNDNTIVFPSVTPEVFELAVKVFQEPMAALMLKPNDSVKILPFYHMYDFQQGIQACDHKLSEYVTEHALREDSIRLPKVECFIDCLVLAEKYKLPKTYPLATDYVRKTFLKPDIADGCCPEVQNSLANVALTFSVEHITRSYLTLKLFSVKGKPNLSV